MLFVASTEPTLGDVSALSYLTASTTRPRRPRRPSSPWTGMADGGHVLVARPVLRLQPGGLHRGLQGRGWHDPHRLELHPPGRHRLLRPGQRGRRRRRAAEVLYTAMLAFQAVPLAASSRPGLTDNTGHDAFEATGLFVPRPPTGSTTRPTPLPRLVTGSRRSPRVSPRPTARRWRTRPSADCTSTPPLLIAAYQRQRRRMQPSSARRSPMSTSTASPAPWDMPATASRTSRCRSPHRRRGRHARRQLASDGGARSRRAHHPLRLDRSTP